MGADEPLDTIGNANQSKTYLADPIFSGHPVLNVLSGHQPKSKTFLPLLAVKRSRISVAGTCI